MLQEAGKFFAIVFVILVVACVYIESQGGSPFTITSHSSPLQGGTCKDQDYHCMARADAVQAGIDPDLFERQINQESGWNPNAVSSAGAIGIAQIMPSTAKGWNVDPWNPVASLKAAASAMARYYTTYQSYPKALAAYNAGTDTLNTAISRYGANWEIGVPAETRNYILAITGVRP